MQSDLSANAADCANSFEWEPDFECTEFMSSWITDVEINTACGEGFKQAKFMIFNDESPRTFSNNQLKIRPWSELSFSDNINQLQQLNYDASIDEMSLRISNLSLAANGKYELDFEINYDDIVSDFSVNDIIANIKFQSTNFAPPLIEQTSTVFTRPFYPEDRSIVMSSGSSTQDLLTAIQSKFNTANNDVNEIEILMEGLFVVDQDLSLGETFTVKMSDDARIDVVNGSTFTMMNNAIVPCSYMRWDQIYVESGSNINFRNVFMRKGENGIRTEANISGPIQSDIMIDFCTFEDFTDRGISIETNSKVTISNTILSDIGSRGIHMDGAIDISNFSDNNISNAEFGVRIYNNPHSISHNRPHRNQYIGRAIDGQRFGHRRKQYIRR